MDLWWAWSVLLLVVGLALAVLEVFIPSGGILGFLALCSILASVAMPFLQGHPMGGLAFLVLAMFGLPVVIVLALRWWPRTPIGRKILLDVPDETAAAPDAEKRRGLRELVGRTGRAKSKMLLSGAISIDGRTIDAVSDGMPIEPGQQVRVIKIEGTAVVVRPVEEETPLETHDEQDPLARPIDAVGPDPFDDPAA